MVVVGVAFPASRVVVYLAMSSKSGACCGVVPIDINVVVVSAVSFKE